MRIEKYTSEHFPLLAAAAEEVNLPLLASRRFVEFYYLGQPWSELYLGLDETDRCIAFMGVDRMRFEYTGQPLEISMATNFYTLRPGVGGFLWLQWMRTSPYALVFGGSSDTHKLLKPPRFIYYEGIEIFLLNGSYEIYTSDSAWRALIKRFLQSVTRKRLVRYGSRRFLKAAASITVHEFRSSDAEMLRSSAFDFRFAPSVEYLRWRYNTGLGFVHYRWFEIQSNGKKIGYCILNDAPNQIAVVHSDGCDPEALAFGTLKAIFTVSLNDRGIRTALLASSHPQMQGIFARYGFRSNSDTRPLVIGSLTAPPVASGTNSWLVNFGWGDNDLRASMFYHL